MLTVQGATVLGALPTAPLSDAFGATILSGAPPSVQQAANQILGIQAPANSAPSAPHPWRGAYDPLWPYSAGDLHLDEQGAALMTETCACGDQTHLEGLTSNSWSVQNTLIEHAHTYRVTCTVCLWYANVAADQVYPIPAHSQCRGAYKLVRSELYAYPIYKWREQQFDSTPAYWTLYNHWTGKYVENLAGDETPDHDLAHHFDTEADAVQFARQSPGALAHALAQPAPADAVAQCGFCSKTYPLGTIECTACLTRHAGSTLEDLIRSMFSGGMRSWVAVHPYNAAGRSVRGGGFI